MKIAKYFWNLNKKALKETEKVLKNPNHPRFSARMVTILSRCEQPKELFTLISKKEFVEAWPKIKAHWLRIARESDFREWWQAIYEQLLQQYKQKRPKGKQSILFLQIGRKIREARVQKGLSQKELALIVGMKQPDISKIEDGKKNITLETLATLSRALNIKKINLS